MHRASLLLICLLGLSPLASAGVYMCTDPETGKKTFTDKACATKGTGEKIKVQPKNFGGSGHRTANETKTWISDRDQAKVGRDNFTGHAGQVENARSVNPASGESEK